MKKSPASQPVVEEQERNNELPEGWAQTTLSEICEINPPKPATDALRPDALVTFVPMPAVDAELGAITNSDTRQFSDVRKGYTAFREGDVIMAKITPCMENGKAAIARQLQNGLGFGSTEFHVLRPRDRVLADFVYHFIRRESYRKDAESEMTGSVGQKRVPADFIESTAMLLAPYEEQRRIIKTLTELITKNRTTRNRLERVPKILKAFRQSVLAAACSGRLTEDWRTGREEVELGEDLLKRIDTNRRETWTSGHHRDSKSSNGRYSEPQRLDSEDLPAIPDTWTWATLDQIGQEGRPIVYGIIKPGPHVPSGIPYVRVMEMKDGEVVDVSQLRRASPERAAKFERSTLASGDILISKDGTIGRVAIVPPELAGGNVTQHVMRVPVHKFMDRDYVVATVRAPHAQRWLLGELKGVALQGVNVEDFRRLPVPVPPILEQHEIVRRVEALFKLADKIEKRVEAATKRADKLTQSILAKAFRGELVPTEAELARKEGRNYEPASDLLARIRSARENSAATKFAANRKSRPTPTGKG